MDIFNMSRISYLAFSFLHIYINSYLINILQNDKHIHHTTSIQSPNDKQLNNDTKIILQFIINLIVHIEFILNLHLFIIIYIIRKSSNDNTNQHNVGLSKPKLLYKLDKICGDIQSSIKPSTTILLLLKINRKLCNILDVFDNSLLIKETGFIKQAKELNSKINNLLDAFILAIAKNTKCQNTTSTSSSKYTNANHNIMIERYELCVNYILDLANILYMYFDIAFDIFIKYLKLENTSNDNSQTRFDNTKKCISDLLKSELFTLETNFFEY